MHFSSPRAAVPNLFGTRDWFHGRQFFYGGGGGERARGMVQAVMQATGSDGEQQMKLWLLASCSPPAVWPGA